MMDNQAVKSLLEMGIPHEVAVDALQRTGGNLEAAVNFIFSNELPEQASTGQPMISENRMVSDIETSTYDVPNSGDQDIDMPDVVGGDGDGEAYDDLTDDHSGSSSSNSRGPDHYSISDTSLPPPSYSIVQHNQFKSAVDDPTVVLPLPLNSLIESYFGLFALLASMYFPHVFLKPDFQDLNYRPDWFKGSSFAAPRYRLAYHESNDGSTTSEIVVASGLSKDPQPHLLWQLQKLISVVNAKACERAFVSAKLFTLSLEPQLRSKLADSEHLYEVLPTFIKSLAVDLEMCPGIRDRETRNLFISSALHTPDKNEPPMETFLSLFHFLPEEYDSNLYKMFNVLLYPEEEEEEAGNVVYGGEGGHQDGEYSEPENTLKEVAPVLTILFNELETNTETVTLPNGVDVPLEFYPQLYTKRCKDQLIRHIIYKRKQARIKSRSLLQEINNLKSYQGKNISTILESTLAYLQADKKDADNETSKQIASLKDTLNSSRAAKMEEYKDLASKLHGEWNLSHPEIHIINTAKQLGLIENPYILSMAALSPYSYFTRDRDGEWSWTQSNTLGTEFKINKCSPSAVQEAIRRGTKFASEMPLMFIYCEEGKIPTNDEVAKALENNTGCVKFAKDDQNSLNTLRAQFNDSTGNISTNSDQSIDNNNSNDNDNNNDSD